MTKMKIIKKKSSLLRKKPVDECYQYVVNVFLQEYFDFEDDRYLYFVPANIKKYVYGIFSYVTEKQKPYYKELINEIEDKLDWVAYIYDDDYQINCKTELVNDYLFDISEEFKQLIEQKPDYNNLAKDLTTRLKKYIVNIKHMRGILFKGSILYDLVEHRSYNEVVELIIQSFIEQHFACLVSNLKSSNYIKTNFDESESYVDDLPF